MPNRHPFRLNQSGFLLAMISAAFAGQANAAAGKVDFATSGVTVSGSDGRERPLTKGADLDSGDTVKTNIGGRAQIRFTDGAYVSLQPNTDFSIKEYSFDGKADGSERGFFGLAKGAMRAVTGLIGRVNRNRYQISTPTATVGIRGTGGLIAVNSDGSTTITGTSGIWTLTNPAGSLDIPAGKVGVAPTAPNEPPKQTNDQGANVAPPPPVTTTFVAGDQRTATGDPVFGNTLPPIVSGSGFAVGSAFRTTISESTQSVAFAIPGSDVTLDAQGRVISYSAAGGVSSATLLDPVNGHAEANNMDGLAWGRWIGPVQNCISGQPFCRSDSYGPNEGFHYVVGIPTAVMPTQGTGLAYVLLGATQPTFSDGHLAPGTFDGKLTVGFTPTGANVDLDMKVSMADARVYGVSGRMVSSGAFFSGTGQSSLGVQIGGLPLSIVGLAGSSTCSCQCTANVQGFFSGTSAERAGLVYNIKDQGSFSPNSDITGAAAFKKQ